MSQSAERSLASLSEDETELEARPQVTTSAQDREVLLEFSTQLSLLTTNIQSSTGRIMGAFDAPLHPEAPSVSLFEALEKSSLGLSQEDGAALVARGQQSVEQISAELKNLLSYLQNATHKLEEGEQHIAALLSLVSGLRKIGRTSGFLAVQSSIQAGHMQDTNHGQFHNVGQHITELVATLQDLCSGLEQGATDLQTSTLELLTDVRQVTSMVLQAESMLSEQGSLVQNELNRYVRIVHERFKEVYVVERALFASVADLYRGLQFEDMSTQLITSIQKKLTNPEGYGGAEGAVSQDCMDPGDAELF